MNFLIKKLIKNHTDTGNPAVRAAYGKLSGAVGIICNTALFIAKIIAGSLTGSVSVTADAVNNLSDASSGMISLLSFKLSARPADKEHPYGHGRYEYLAGFMVAVLILVIGVELFQSSLDKIIRPEPVLFRWASAGILAASIPLKLWMMRFNRKTGKIIRSKTLLTAAADSRNDVLATSAVLLASLISYRTGLELDGWMGLAVAVFIIVSGFGLVKETLDPLLGRAPGEEEVEQIRARIMSYPGILGTHDLLIHDYGPGRRFASVHAEIAAEDGALKSHGTVDRIERDFLKDGLHMLVHCDPIPAAGEKNGDLRNRLEETIREIHPFLAIHDLRIVPEQDFATLIFDCVVPPGLPLGDADIREQISRLIAEKYAGYRCSVTVDRGFAPIPCSASPESGAASPKPPCKEDTPYLSR